LLGKPLLAGIFTSLKDKKGKLLMDGATKERLLTVGYIDGQLNDLFTKQNCFGDTLPEKEFELLYTQIAVWQRLREHLVEGDIITIDAKDRITWYKMSDFPQDVIARQPVL